MKVDCYNASNLPLSQVTVGDTFYYNDTLYIRVASMFSFISKRENEVAVVDLATGVLTALDEDSVVALADTKIVKDE